MDLIVVHHNETLRDMFFGSESKFRDMMVCMRVLYFLVSLIISSVLKKKFDIMNSNSHFSSLFHFCAVIYSIFCLFWIVTVIILFKLNEFSYFFIISIYAVIQGIRALAPCIQPIISVFVLSYSIAYFFQKDETLENILNSRKSSVLVWTASIFYALWSHPFNGYNVLNLFFETSTDETYNVVMFNSVEILITLFSICLTMAKIIGVYRHKPFLSTLEMANLTLISIVLCFNLLFTGWLLVFLDSSPHSRRPPFSRLGDHLMNGTWMMYSFLAPFLYPYCMMITIIFFETNTRIRKFRRVRFYNSRLKIIPTS